MQDMNDFSDLAKLDPRFSAKTYSFVEEVLEYANYIGMARASDEGTPTAGHITGQDLCYAAVEYATEQYGYMAREVLSKLGILKTGDIGDVVYKMIESNYISQSPEDDRADFDNVFDLAEELEARFHFTYSKDHKRARFDAPQ